MKETKKDSSEKEAAVRKRLSKAMAGSSSEEIAKVTEEEGPVWVETQNDLADELGATRRSIIRWLKEGMPGRKRGKYNVVECRAWAKSSGKTSGVEAASPMKVELEVRKLTAQCEALELAQQIKLGQYHLNDDCKLWVGKAMTAVRTILLSLPSKMAPVIEMRPKEECETLLRDAIDEALIVIHEREWPTAKVS